MEIIYRALAPASNLPGEFQITLAAERRQFLKRRWRGIASDGIEFGFDLEERLTNDAVIFQCDGKDYIVRQLPERVYEILLKDTAHAALAAWKVGNLHLPVQILEDRIRVLHDETMAKLLARESWSFSEPEVIFTPLKAMAHT